MKIDTLEKLYVHELKDLHSAETQILEELPKLIDAANDTELERALTEHAAQTRGHLDRLEQIFQDLDYEPGGHRCKGIAGLLVEGRELLSEVEDKAVIDAAIISACQRVEHYEMAGYGVARAFAQKLGRDEDAQRLTETLEEEGAADRLLSNLATHHINFLAHVG